MGDEDCFPLISVLDLNMIATPFIKFGEDLGIFDFVDKVQDQGKRIGILDCIFIHVILARL